MLKLAIGFLLAAGATSAAAYVKINVTNEISATIPDTSSFRNPRFDKDNSWVRFGGIMQLTGRYYYSLYDPDSSEQLEILVFALDTSESAKLPCVLWKNDSRTSSCYQVRQLGLMVGEGKLFDSLVSPAMQRALKSKSVPFVSGQVTISVDQLTVGYECDQIYHSVRLTKVVTRATIQLADGAAPHFGC